MRMIVQQVTSASVRVDEETTGSIDNGLVVLVGFGVGDTQSILGPMADKLVNLRIFPDERGRFQYSLRDAGGAVLVVPNFTLYGDTTKGRRPEFTAALQSDDAAVLFEEFIAALRRSGIARVEAGRFGADMQVVLVNDGPVTFVLES
jgi:D-tyrosyl-tRNA(Tyr) deacylase